MLIGGEFGQRQPNSRSRLLEFAAFAPRLLRPDGFVEVIDKNDSRRVQIVETYSDSEPCSIGSYGSMELRQKSRNGLFSSLNGINGVLNLAIVYRRKIGGVLGATPSIRGSDSFIASTAIG